MISLGIVAGVSGAQGLIASEKEFSARLRAVKKEHKSDISAAMASANALLSGSNSTPIFDDPASRAVREVREEQVASLRRVFANRVIRRRGSSLTPDGKPLYYLLPYIRVNIKIPQTEEEREVFAQLRANTAQKL